MRHFGISHYFAELDQMHMLSTVFGWCKGKGPASATRVSGLSLRGLNLTCRNAAQISNKSLMPGGVMLYASPIVSSTSVLISVVAVLLSPLTFLLGWMAGMSTFAHSYEPFRRRHRPWSFAFLLPVILAMTVGLGLLGGRYWWLLSFGLAFLGHRKGTQHVAVGAKTTPSVARCAWSKTEASQPFTSCCDPMKLAV
jgi:hypothetical protein